MLPIAVGDEVDTRRRFRVDDYGGIVDALPGPEVVEGPAEGIVAQLGDIADGRPLPGGGDGAVGGVAAVALQVDGLTVALDGAEFEQRLSETD